jgi:predicted transcriptional regulator
VRVRFPDDRSLNEVVSDLKRRLVVEALHRAGGRRKRAAGLLGLSPDALKHYMKVFDLYR